MGTNVSITSKRTTTPKSSRTSLNSHRKNMAKGNKFHARNPHKVRKISNTSNEFHEFSLLIKTTLPHLFPDVLESMIHRNVDQILHLYKYKGPEYLLRYLKGTSETLEALFLKVDVTLEHEKVSIGKDYVG